MGSWKHSGPCECDNDKQEAGYCRFAQVLSEKSGGDKKNQQNASTTSRGLIEISFLRLSSAIIEAIL